MPSTEWPRTIERMPSHTAAEPGAAPDASGGQRQPAILTEGARPTPAIRTAGTLRRGLAALLDAIPVLAAAAGLSVALAPQLIAPLAGARFNLLDALVDVINADPTLLAVPGGALLGGVVIWHLVFGVILGASPGKLALGLRLAGPDGERLGPGRAAAHAVLRALSLALLATGQLWSVADPARRTLYDRLAGVYVVIAAPAGTAAAGPDQGVIPRSSFASGTRAG